MTQNPQLVMLPAKYLKNKIEPDHEPVTFANISNDAVWLIKHIPNGTLQFFTKYQDRQDISVIETNQIIVANENDALLFTLWDAKLVCSPAEIEIHRKINF